MSSKERIQYIHLFRGVAILFIVLSHLIWNTGDHPEIKRSIRLILSNSTIFFLIISGFLFEHLSNNYKPVPYLIKKIKYILLPYFFCSIPIIAFKLFRFPEPNLFTQTLYYLITGSHIGPYWYIPVIFAIFLTSPIIIFIKQFKAFQYLLIITLAYSILTKRPESYNVLKNLIYYFGFFHLGIILAMHRQKVETWFSRKRFMITATTIWAATHISLNNNTLPPCKTLQLVMLAGIIMNACYHIKSPKLIDIFNLLANYSFGIYFLHQYIIDLLAILVVRLGGDYRSLTYSLAIFPLVVCLSVLGVYFIKITVGSSKSRLLIGS